MSLVDHLGELRSRLFKALLAIGVGSVIGYLVAVPVRNFLILPLGPDRTLQVLGMGDAFVIQIKISIVIGIILAMPVLLYQVWAFVAPGLTPAERQIGPAVDPAGPRCSSRMGVAIAYIILPYAIQFLFSFTDDKLVAAPAAGPGSG